MKQIKKCSLLAVLALLLCLSALLAACDTPNSNLDPTDTTDTTDTSDTTDEQLPPAESQGLELYFNEHADAYIVTGIGTCTDTDIVIPKSVNGYPIDWIGQNAFYDNQQITSIVIPEGVECIDHHAFCGASNLTSVVIPDSATDIGIAAFSDCPSLTSITVGKNNPVYHSSGNCLIETKTKTLLTGCQNSIIPDDGSVKVIALNAFSNCKNLKAITIPESITAIEQGAFSGCSSLTSVSIPKSIKILEKSTFGNCSKLESVSLPNGITALGEYAFSGCTSLKTVSIPASLTEIGKNAFVKCPVLTNIAVDPNNPKYHTVNGCLVETATKTLLVGISGGEIPTDGSVTAIAENAFRYCRDLGNLTIPDCITSIGAGAFSYCAGLKSVSIPNTAITLDGSLFCYSELESVTLPQSITEIKEYTFQACSELTYVYYFGTAEEWQRITVAENNSALTKATVFICFYSENPPTDSDHPYWHMVNGVPTRW